MRQYGRHEKVSYDGYLGDRLRLYITINGSAACCAIPVWLYRIHTEGRGVRCGRRGILGNRNQSSLIIVYTL